MKRLPTRWKQKIAFFSLYTKLKMKILATVQRSPHLKKKISRKEEKINKTTLTSQQKYSNGIVSSTLSCPPLRNSISPC